MARLILSIDGQVLAEYNLNKERYTIGRYPDNDIRIDNPAVSGHHSLIINILNDSFLEDLNSTNGTYVNGKLIKKHSLQHGDVITAGHHQLRFVEEEEVSDSEFQKTMVITPGAADRSPSQSGLTAIVPTLARGSAAAAAAAAAAAESAGSPAPAPRSVALDAVATSPSVVRPPARAKLQVLSGAFAGREMELTKTLTTLGRPGVQVAAISRRADGFYIVQVESAQPDDFPVVNGASIGPQARRLDDNDVIQVAGVKMGFFTH